MDKFDEWQVHKDVFIKHLRTLTPLEVVDYGTDVSERLDFLSEGDGYWLDRGKAFRRWLGERDLLEMLEVQKIMSTHLDYAKRMSVVYKSPEDFSKELRRMMGHEGI